MNYLSVCSGIEAATVAWETLGWNPVAFAEVEKFPSAVLAHHYPNVPNWGDITKHREWPNADIDVLVGGTPCQPFSVAGLRKGLADPRGNLTLTYLEILDRYRPKWMVWENVPGVLSSHKGRDFGAFLGALAELGYGFAYRVLDAQYFGVPQRRRRVFVVGHFGDWRGAAEVLFERSCMSGHPPPSHEKGEEVALPLGARVDRGGSHGETKGNNLIVAFGGNNTSGHIDVATAVNACGSPSGRMDFESETFVVLHPFPGNPSVRRLTPRECERLQGFPDDYTLIAYRGNPASDAPRYKALGNSMAVPVMRWIGSRIQAKFGLE